MAFDASRQHDTQTGSTAALSRQGSCLPCKGEHQQLWLGLFQLCNWLQTGDNALDT